jgi:hypothetical protein
MIYYLSQDACGLDVLFDDDPPDPKRVRILFSQ